MTSVCNLLRVFFLTTTISKWFLYFGKPVGAPAQHCTLLLYPQNTSEVKPNLMFTHTHCRLAEGPSGILQMANTSLFFMLVIFHSHCTSGMYGTQSNTGMHNLLAFRKNTPGNSVAPPHPTPPPPPKKTGDPHISFHNYITAGARGGAVG